MSFAEILGQDGPVSLLTGALARERVAHGYVLTGPEGVGKRRAAAELARALLCPRRAPGTAEACGACPECVRCARGTHSSYQVVTVPEDKREIPIAWVRERVIEPLGLRSADGGWRVFVVDPADALNAEAANCLLKTLEEPSPRVALVLVTARVEHLLPTILSRCQVLRFRPLPLAIGRRVLAAAAPAAKPAELDQALAAAAGSPGLALRVLSHKVLAAWSKWGDRILAMGPVEAMDLAAEVADWLKKGAATLEDRRVKARPFLELLALRLRERFLAEQGLAPATPGAAPGPRRPLELAERVMEAQLALDRNLKVDFVIEELFLAIADQAAYPGAQNPSSPATVR
ncbi:MAG: hypothetical protein HZA54_18960 [Planctomycetes bacterium]|nr:hypothetical protein [Planctomycetota bacterium]